jgi:hypothetical protein
MNSDAIDFSHCEATTLRTLIRHWESNVDRTADGSPARLFAQATLDSLCRELGTREEC